MSDPVSDHHKLPVTVTLELQELVLIRRCLSYAEYRAVAQTVDKLVAAARAQVPHDILMKPPLPPPRIYGQPFPGPQAPASTSTDSHAPDAARWGDSAPSAAPLKH